MTGEYALSRHLMAGSEGRDRRPTPRVVSVAVAVVPVYTNDTQIDIRDDVRIMVA